MGRNIGEIVQQELENLDKDSDSRKLAMKALKLYVKDMDSTAIPSFLAQVSETKETGGSHSNGEYTISLYEVLARVHGPSIIPQIDNIMSTIIKTLSSSAGSFALHQACSKVVPAISRYAIDPSTSDDKKRFIVHSLSKPLTNSLLGSHESLSSGSALCLKALVESDNWRFAAKDVVNDVCLKVAGCLEEESLQTNSHMGLVMALAKRNPVTVEAYARLLLHSGLRILNTGMIGGNSQKRLSAIQMVNFLLKSLDSRSVFSELDLIIEEMEKCRDDQMAFVKGAAFEAMETARRIVSEKGPKIEKECTGSNFSNRRKNTAMTMNGGDLSSPLTGSPESQTHNSFLESPISSRQVSPTFMNNFDKQSVNRKLWSYENGGVDVSLKDGLSTEMKYQGSTQYSDEDEPYRNIDMYDDHTHEFEGFIPRSPRNGHLRSTTPSPQRSRSQDIKIFTTPRRLMCSLQENGNGTELKSRSSKFTQNGPHHGQKNGFARNLNMSENEEETGSSSSDDVLEDEEQLQVLPQASTTNNNKLEVRKKAIFFLSILVLFASLLWIGDHPDEAFYYSNAVPT